jgi:hypothetical protein
VAVPLLPLFGFNEYGPPAAPPAPIDIGYVVLLSYVMAAPFAVFVGVGDPYQRSPPAPPPPP